jgi:Fe-S oxidoreductase
MRLEDATAITARCFHGEPASCSHPCPFRFDIRNFLERAKAGKWGLAYKLLRNAVVFPAIVCELCPAPCLSECQRAALGDEPVQIRDIEAACIRFARDRRPEYYRIPPRESRVAVVGAGLAGLSCALNLAQKQYAVTVFDRADGPGGSLAAHPRHSSFLEEIALQFSAVKASWAFGTRVVGADDPLLAGFGAVYVATGGGGDDFGLRRTELPGDGRLPEPRPAGAGEFGLRRTGFFAGGELCGMDKMASVAYGVTASKLIETWLQTGSMPTLQDADPKPDGMRSGIHYVGHAGEPKAARVIAASPEGYSAEEAKAEAARCMGCDCSLCLDACEMLARFKKRPQKIAIEAYSDTKSNPPFASCALTRETYSCNLCGYCKSVCPVGVDMGALFQLARAGRAETGKQPKVFHDFWLRDLAWHSDARNGGAFHALPEGKPSCAYAFFPGCKLGSRDPGQTAKAAAALLRGTGAGIVLDCCGAPAYWAGENEIFRTQLDRVRNIWAEMGHPVFVFACAYCMRLFSEFLPEISRVSLYELLLDCGAGTDAEAKAALESRGGSGRADELSPCVASDPGVSHDTEESAPCVFGIFDPCVSGGFPEMRAAVRALARNAGAQLSELSEEGRCCGFGGHMRTANPELFDLILDRRASENDAPYLVYCANCADSFELAGKESRHILDLLFGHGEQRPECLPGGPTAAEGAIPATFGRGEQRPGSLQDRRDNALSAKQRLVALYGMRTVPPEPKPWDEIAVNIPQEMFADLDKRLIMTDDIREAIWAAEATNEKFCLSGDDVFQCSLEKPVVIYWVRYRKVPGNPCSFDIMEAYCHRMRFLREG